MDLENLGLREMDCKELVNIDAGWDWSGIGKAAGVVVMSMAIHIFECAISPLLPTPREILN